MARKQAGPAIDRAKGKQLSSEITALRWEIERQAFHHWYGYCLIRCEWSSF